MSGFITTNYDCFLETIVDNYTTYIGQENLVFSSIQGIAEIYKIHGCVSSPNSIVINEADYIDFDSKSAYLAAKLMTIFVEFPIIFIGYSVTDVNIKKYLML
ncbi:SIR2 family NAD-dependent protein deacylase [Clostridioides difficile]